MSTSSTGTSTSTVKPFKISVPESQLDTLRQKLHFTTFPDELKHHGDGEDGNASADWSTGAPLAEIKRLTAYWKESFDWRKMERELNERLPQFVTTVPVAGFGELEIHFVYQKSKTEGRKAIPLLFLHGCK